MDKREEAIRFQLQLLDNMDDNVTVLFRLAAAIVLSSVSVGIGLIVLEILYWALSGAYENQWLYGGLVIAGSIMFVPFIRKEWVHSNKEDLEKLGIIGLPEDLAIESLEAQEKDYQIIKRDGEFCSECDSQFLVGLTITDGRVTDVQEPDEVVR